MRQGLRRACAPLLGAGGLAAAALGAGCSIDFVTTEEVSRTSIRVSGDHTDSLRAKVSVEHDGSRPDVEVNGISGVPSAEPDPGSDHTFDFELTLDPATPTLEIRVDRDPGGPIAVDAALLTRTGEAICTAGGDLHLPAAPLGLAGDEGAGGWSIRLLDEEDTRLASVSRPGAPPDSMVVPGALLSDSVAFVRVEVGAGGSLTEGVVYPAWIDVLSATEWAAPEGCP